MKVTFESSLEDFVDIMLRSAGGSRAFYGNVLALAIGTGGITGLILYLYLQSWIGSIVGFAVGSIYIFAFNFRIRERRARKFYEQQFQTSEPITIDVEISESGISFKQVGETIIREWNTVESIEESDDAIYFRTRNNLVSAVRKRAFQTEVEKQGFLDLARGFMGKASLPPPPTFS